MLLFPVAIAAIEDESDRDFMERLYIEYEKLMFKASLQITHNEFDADDVVNTACVHLIRNLSKLRGMQCNQLRNYIVITCRNASFDLLRERKRDLSHRFFAENDVLEAIPDDKNELDLFLNADALKHALAKLPERYAELLTWRYLHGLSNREIAKRGNMKESTVKVAVHRARARLAALISEEIKQNHGEF